MVEKKAQFPLLTHHLLLFKKHFWMINYPVVIILERNVLWYYTSYMNMCLSVCKNVYGIKKDMCVNNIGPNHVFMLYMKHETVTILHEYLLDPSTTQLPCLCTVTRVSLLDPQ